MKKIFVLLFLIITAIFLYKAIFIQDRIIGGEVLGTHYSNFYLFKESILTKGEIPTQNPYIYGGTYFYNPFLLSPVFFFPIMLFSIENSFALIYLIFIFLAGISMFCLIKKLFCGLNNYCALLGSMVYMFSGTIASLVHLGHMGFLHDFIFIPLIFLFFYELIKEKKLKYSILIGLLLFLEALFGNQQYALYSISFFICYYIIYLIFCFIKKNNLELIKKSTIIIAIFLFLAWLLPVSFILNKGSESVRGSNDLTFSTGNSFPPYHLVRFIVPNAFGSSLDNSYISPSDYLLTNSYIGIMPFILSLIALFFSKKTKLLYFLIAAIVFYFLFAFGKYFYLFEILWKFIPFLKFVRSPSKILLLITFCLSILSAYGMFRLNQKLNNKQKEKLKIFSYGILALGVILIFSSIIIYSNKPFFENFFEKEIKEKYSSYTYEHVYEKPSLESFMQRIPSMINQQISGLIIAGLFAFFSSFLIFLRAKEKISLKKLNIIVILFVLFDLWLFAFPFINTVKTSETLKSTPIMDFLEKDKTDFSVLDMVNAIPLYLSVPNHIKLAGGYGDIYLKKDYVEKMKKLGEGMFIDGAEIYELQHPEYLNELNIKYVASKKELKFKELKLVFEYNEVKVYENIEWNRA